MLKSANRSLRMSQASFGLADRLQDPHLLLENRIVSLDFHKESLRILENPKQRCQRMGTCLPCCRKMLNLAVFMKWAGRAKKKRIAGGFMSTAEAAAVAAVAAAVVVAVVASVAAAAAPLAGQTWPGDCPIPSATTNCPRTPSTRTICIILTTARFATIEHLSIWTRSRWGSLTIRSCIPAFRPPRSAGVLPTPATTPR